MQLKRRKTKPTFVGYITVESYGFADDFKLLTTNNQELQAGNHRTVYGFPCVALSKRKILVVEKLQKWRNVFQETSYVNQLRLSNILPLPMFLQLNDILTLVIFSLV